ncbi:PD-(D/E)XK motif protein [Streptomyces sp. NBC_00239]|uniref:PD-(D/E)XK motif protein n=1 Tax=Streptomyces sp. NBC_00239 TaxID=2903640 RepID=UPI002E27C95A|nr:PD-(D/E)XK motif protein [Streptomyces sp. NBC_00239]
MTEPVALPELAWSTVEHYLGRKQAVSYRLSSASARRLVSYEVGDGGQSISLFVELDRHGWPPRSDLPAVVIDPVSRNGLRMARISTSQVALMRDFHDLLMAVAERVLLGDRTLDEAFGETVRAWTELLNRSRGLSLERRLGLHGELAILRALARRHGWPEAVESWRGPRAEEHDFGLRDVDLEVKTTSSEERRHTVHGLGQLRATAGRPLWLASVQLTRGGLGGRSLKESVTAVRDKVAADRIAAARLEIALAASGWSDSGHDDERWTPRTEPLVVPAEELPRLTDAMIPEPIRDHISLVSYRIHVSHLAQGPGSPLDLTDFRLP